MYVFFYSKVDFRGRRAMWNGVWILTLLLYPSLVYTCVMLLNCPNLPDTTGSNDVSVGYIIIIIVKLTCGI